MEIPDFDTIYAMISILKEKSLDAGRLDVEIKATESDITRLVTETDKFLIDGKRPSVSYIKSALTFTGLDGSLLDKRYRLEELKAEIDVLKRELDFVRLSIEVWRTEQANMRSSSL